MSVDDRLLYESRVRTRQVIVAGVAALALVVAALIQVTGPHAKVQELTLDLITVHKRFPRDVIGAVINAIGLVSLAGALSYLYGAARARNPQLQAFIRILVLAGGGLAGVAGVAYAIVIAVKSNQFVHSAGETYQQANHLTSAGAILILQLGGQLGALLLAIGFLLVSLGAMRVGLLSKFMGYLGIFAGILVLFQITPVPVVQAYWLVALAYLLSGRWPTGVPPAWRSGRAEPWPSSSSLRQQRAAGVPGRRAKRAPAPAPEPVGASAAPARTRSETPKRKRKRRQ
ncbi:MAG: hypothetical protein ABSG43_14895 [Solirubrobacteraceae bacterium]|jgi:hypothetical protein